MNEHLNNENRKTCPRNRTVSVPRKTCQYYLCTDRAAFGSNYCRKHQYLGRTINGPVRRTCAELGCQKSVLSLQTYCSEHRTHELNLSGRTPDVGRSEQLNRIEEKLDRLLEFLDIDDDGDDA